MFRFPNELTAQELQTRINYIRAIIKNLLIASEAAGCVPPLSFWFETLEDYKQRLSELT